MLHDDNELDATIPVARESNARESNVHVATRPARSKRWTIPPPIPAQALKPKAPLQTTPIVPTVTLETAGFASWVVDTEIVARTRYPRGTEGDFDATEPVPMPASRWTTLLLIEGLAVLVMIVVVIVLALR